MTLDWQSSLILVGLAIIALLLFTFIWGQFATPSNNNHYTPVTYFKTEDIPDLDVIVPIEEEEVTTIDEISVDEISSVEESSPIKQPTPIVPKKQIIQPIKPTRYKRRKITGEIVPLYSKKRRSRGENMCARSLEELFGVPFPSERPNWAMGRKGRPLEYDCINHKFKLALEYHGQQHYEPGHFRMDDDGFADQNERDRMKFEYAKENGYYLITVPYTVPLEEIKDYIISYLPGNRKRRLDEDLTL